MVFQNLKKSDYAYLTRKDLHLLNRDEDAPPAKINRMVANRQVVNPILIDVSYLGESFVKQLDSEMKTKYYQDRREI